MIFPNVNTSIIYYVRRIWRYVYIRNTFDLYFSCKDCHVFIVMYTQQICQPFKIPLLPERRRVHRSSFLWNTRHRSSSRPLNRSFAGFVASFQSCFYVYDFVLTGSQSVPERYLRLNVKCWTNTSAENSSNESKLFAFFPDHNVTP